MLAKQEVGAARSGRTPPGEQRVAMPDCHFFIRFLMSCPLLMIPGGMLRPA